VNSARSSGPRTFAAVTALLVTSFVVTTNASAASGPTGTGGIGVRLLANKSASLTGPLGLLYVVERLAPGQGVLRHVEISNTTTSRVEVRVFAAAASDPGNTFTFAPGRSANALTKWTTVARSEIRLAPGATTIEAITINVPKRAPAGERYAVLWAQVSAPSPTQSGVRLVNRVGVRMYVSVGKGGAPAAKFTVGSLVAGRLANGDALIAARVGNVGVAAIDVTGKLTLSHGPGGLSAGPFRVTLGTMLAPRHSATERIELSGQLPRGPWRADLSLSSEGTSRNSIATITFPALVVPSVTRSSRSPLMLVMMFALALLLALGGSVVFSRRRRLRIS
jgi:hypothetical protein